MAETQLHPLAPGLNVEDVQYVSPALAHYTQEAIIDGVWKRPGLNVRDRALITVAALIGRMQTQAMPHYFDKALEIGVKPSELSETILHLAFYSGFPNAMAAVPPAMQVFQKRKVNTSDLPAVKEKLLPLNEEAETQRRTQVANNFGAVSPGLVQNTTDLLFTDLWLRPALAPRDRSLVTVSALIASGQSQQITYHLNRAMDNGLTQTEASEIPTHLAFYSGWPNCFSALPVMKEVFAKRGGNGHGETK
jgi:4-carboxymuconolactone decarboxylase